MILECGGRGKGESCLTRAFGLLELTSQYRNSIPMRGRKKSEETRLAILRCAAEVFSERPYHQVLTDEISARLGIGKGTLYRYFASKEELYVASIVDGLQGMQEAIDETLRQDVPLERIIEELARTIISYFWGSSPESVHAGRGRLPHACQMAVT